MKEQSQTSDSLAELLARTSRADRAAFADLYQATSMKLYGVVFRILKRKHLAEDVMQDSYVRVWEKAHSFDPQRGSAIAWMVAIARNRALDEVRRRPQILSAEDVPDFDNIVSLDRGAEDQIIDGEAHRKLAHCLDGLEADRRKMIILAYQDGLSRETLAHMFKTPVATVKTWLRRSLASLKECLGNG